MDTLKRADGGEQGRVERIEAIAARFEDLGRRIHEADTSPEVAERERHEVRDRKPPSRADDATDDAYLQEAHSGAREELLEAASDLEHRTLELQQALEVYPSLGDDRPKTAAHRDVLLEDLDEVALAVERVYQAGTRLVQLEVAEA